MLPDLGEFFLVAIGELDQLLKDTVRHRLFDGGEDRAFLNCFA